eukprot:m.169661 g.169661  ORF g.169661 m.169661 type:complete len:135 (-) comp18250_c0_seq1:196-600(-)
MGKKKGKSKKGKKAGKEKGGGTELDAVALAAKRAEHEIAALKAKHAQQVTVARRASNYAMELKETHDDLAESLQSTRLDVVDVSTSMQRQYKQLQSYTKSLETRNQNLEKECEQLKRDIASKDQIIDDLRSQLS